MDELPDLSQLSDQELIDLYHSFEAEDPEIDRIANEMESRGIDH